VEIFSSEFDFTADTKPGDRFRLLIEKRYAGDDFVDYGQLLVGAVPERRPRAQPAWASSRPVAGRPTMTLPGAAQEDLPQVATRIHPHSRRASRTHGPHPILGGVRPHLAVDLTARRSGHRYGRWPTH